MTILGIWWMEFWLDEFAVALAFIADRTGNGLLG
jgi:hypothetical protein